MNSYYGNDLITVGCVSLLSLPAYLRAQPRGEERDRGEGAISLKQTSAGVWRVAVCWCLLVPYLTWIYGLSCRGCLCVCADAWLGEAGAAGQQDNQQHIHWKGTTNLPPNTCPAEGVCTKF